MKYQMETRLGSTGDVRPHAPTNLNIESNWGNWREGREAELTNMKEVRGKHMIPLVISIDPLNSLIMVVCRMEDWEQPNSSCALQGGLDSRGAVA